MSKTWDGQLGGTDDLEPVGKVSDKVGSTA